MSFYSPRRSGSVACSEEETSSSQCLRKAARSATGMAASLLSPKIRKTPFSKTKRVRPPGAVKSGIFFGCLAMFIDESRESAEHALQKAVGDLQDDESSRLMEHEVEEQIEEVRSGDEGFAAALERKDVEVIRVQQKESTPRGLECDV